LFTFYGEKPLLAVIHSHFACIVQPASRRSQQQATELSGKRGRGCSVFDRGRENWHQISQTDKEYTGEEWGVGEVFASACFAMPATQLFFFLSIPANCGLFIYQAYQAYLSIYHSM